MTSATTSLESLNAASREEFVAVCGPCFEASPWIAERTWVRRPFGSLGVLHRALYETMAGATREDQLALIRAHPDLVGRLAREGKMTAASRAEQFAAGLTALTAEEVASFDQYNAAYHKKFGFPFVICARENKKEAILAAFPRRLENTPEQELETALAEIARIAGLRLRDRVTDRGTP